MGNISWSLVAAVNAADILTSNLLASKESGSAQEVIIRHHSLNAGAAYNSGLDEATGEVVVFAHQDVYLPPGWGRILSESIGRLTDLDPEWGVAGLFGVAANGRGVGFVYSTGLQRFVGGPFKEAIRVRTLDEMVLMLRRNGSLRFDETMPGFHLYGTDVCLEAESRGMRNYVIPCFALHNSEPVRRLPWSFWRAYLYLRRKWQDRLPVATPCTMITKWCSPVVHYFLTSSWAAIRGKRSRGRRVPDPSRFYDQRLLPEIAGLRNRPDKEPSTRLRS